MENKTTFIDEFSIRMSPYEHPQITLDMSLPDPSEDWHKFAREWLAMYPPRKNCSGSAFWTRLDNPERGIKRVIFNDPATIVIWEDGTKTVVKCQDGDIYDKQTGLALCVMKKYFGNSSRGLNDILHRWCD